MPNFCCWVEKYCYSNNLQSSQTKQKVPCLTTGVSFTTRHTKLTTKQVLNLFVSLVSIAGGRNALHQKYQ